MTCVVLYAGRPDQREAYEAGLSAGLRAEGVEARLVMEPEAVAAEEVDYLVFAASGPVRDFAPFTRLRAIINLWAGVEAVLALDPPRDVPLLRMIEPGLRLGMVDYCLGHVLRHHLGTDRFVGVQTPVPWEAGYPPLAQDRTVGVLGLGALGRPVAEALAAHGFRTLGWVGFTLFLATGIVALGARGFGWADAWNGRFAMGGAGGFVGSVINSLLFPAPATVPVLDGQGGEGRAFELFSKDPGRLEAQEQVMAMRRKLELGVGARRPGQKQLGHLEVPEAVDVSRPRRGVAHEGCVDPALQAGGRTLQPPKVPGRLR